MYLSQIMPVATARSVDIEIVLEFNCTLLGNHLKTFRKLKLLTFFPPFFFGRDEATQYERVSVRRLVGWSVGWLVRNAFAF